MKNKHSKKNKRLTIGLLNYWWYHPFDTGITNAAIEYDVNLIIFSGSYTTNLPRISSLFPPIHALVNKEMLDGVILNFTSMEDYHLEDYKSSIAERYSSIPTAARSPPATA